MYYNTKAAKSTAVQLVEIRPLPLFFLLSPTFSHHTASIDSIQLPPFSSALNNPSHLFPPSRSPSPLRPTQGGRAFRTTRPRPQQDAANERGRIPMARHGTYDVGAAGVRVVGRMRWRSKVDGKVGGVSSTRLRQLPSSHTVTGCSQLRLPATPAPLPVLPSISSPLPSSLHPLPLRPDVVNLASSLYLAPPLAAPPRGARAQGCLGVKRGEETTIVSLLFGALKRPQSFARPSLSLLPRKGSLGNDGPLHS
jgi:hypothetical protein